MREKKGNEKWIYYDKMENHCEYSIVRSDVWKIKWKKKYVEKRVLEQTFET